MEDNGYFIKTLFRKFAFPTVIGLLGSTISTLINSIMAGNYFGASGLAIIGICSPLFFLFGTLGALISAGSANVAAKYMSDDNLDEVNKLYSIALMLTVVIGAFVSIMGIVFESEIVDMLGGSANLGVLGYYRNYIPFGVFTMLIYIPMNFTRIDGKPKVGLYMFMTMATINMITNYILIAYLNKGIESIALGAGIGALSACVTGFIFIMKKDSNICFKMPSRSYLLGKLPSILVAGSPMSLNNLFSFIKVLLVNSLLIRLNSDKGLATISILWTLNTFAVAIMSGFGQAIVPLVAIFNEERDNTSVRQVVKFSLSTGLIVFSLICLVLVVFSEQVFGIFGLVNISQIEKSAILFFALSLMFAVANVIMSFYFTGTRKILIANIINFGRGILFIVPFAYLFALVQGVRGVWISFLVAEICTTLFSLVFMFVSHKKNAKLSFPLLLDKTSEDDKQYISFSVENNIKEIADCAAKITEFCEDNELSSKQTMLISMSIEEMLTLIMRSSLGAVYPSVAVRILNVDGMIVLRMRYIGAKFNPIDYYHTNISNDIEKSIDIIGIKYIVSTAKTVDYRETFGINNLIISL